jgi:hypothetical protein
MVSFQRQLSPFFCVERNKWRALLTPEGSVFILIDHQAFQFANLHSHDPQFIVGDVIALAKGAKVFGLSTILSTVLAERGGYLVKGLQDVFPDQKPIDRSLINAWQDAQFVKAVKKTGRKLARQDRWRIHFNRNVP